jgi:archaellum biogenesis ATPase FlaH
MFTIEQDTDAVIIVTMDERDQFEDVEVVITDDGTTYLRQYNEEFGDMQLIYMSYQQLQDIAYSLHRTQGMYRIERA